MQPHLPYLIAPLRGGAVWLALAVCSFSAWPEQWAATLGERFAAYPVLAWPVFWLMLNFAILLIVLPFHLLEDHWSRATDREEEHPDATAYWIKAFAGELLLSTFFGMLISFTWWWAPELGWVALCAAWIAYHAVAPRLHEAAHLRQAEQHLTPEPERLAEIQPRLASAGLAIDALASFDDDELDHPPPHDVLLDRRGASTRLVVPKIWVAQWSPDEIVAVTLHHQLMRRPAIVWSESLLQGSGVVLGLGGFVFASRFGCPALTPPLHRMELIPPLLLWLTTMMGLVRVAAAALSRYLVCAADDRVAQQMGSPDGLITSLQRAAENDPAEPPRWAVTLLFHAPTPRQRIARLSP